MAFFISLLLALTTPLISAAASAVPFTLSPFRLDFSFWHGFRDAGFTRWEWYWDEADLVPLAAAGFNAVLVGAWVWGGVQRGLVNRERVTRRELERRQQNEQRQINAVNSERDRADANAAQLAAVLAQRNLREDLAVRRATAAERRAEQMQTAVDDAIVNERAWGQQLRTEQRHRANDRATIERLEEERNDPTQFPTAAQTQITQLQTALTQQRTTATQAQTDSGTRISKLQAEVTALKKADADKAAEDAAAAEKAAAKAASAKNAATQTIRSRTSTYASTETQTQEEVKEVKKPLPTSAAGTQTEGDSEAEKLKAEKERLVKQIARMHRNSRVRDEEADGLAQKLEELTNDNDKLDEKVKALETALKAEKEKQTLDAPARTRAAPIPASSAQTSKKSPAIVLTTALTGARPYGQNTALTSNAPQSAGSSSQTAPAMRPAAPTAIASTPYAALESHDGPMTPGLAAMFDTHVQKKSLRVPDSPSSSPAPTGIGQAPVPNTGNFRDDDSDEDLYGPASPKKAKAKADSPAQEPAAKFATGPAPPPKCWPESPAKPKKDDDDDSGPEEGPDAGESRIKVASGAVTPAAGVTTEKAQSQPTNDGSVEPTEEQTWSHQPEEAETSSSTVQTQSQQPVEAVGESVAGQASSQSATPLPTASTDNKLESKIPTQQPEEAEEESAEESTQQVEEATAQAARPIKRTRKSVRSEEPENPAVGTATEQSSSRNSLSPAFEAPEHQPMSHVTPQQLAEAEVESVDENEELVIAPVVKDERRWPGEDDPHQPDTFQRARRATDREIAIRNVKPLRRRTRPQQPTEATVAPVATAPLSAQPAQPEEDEVKPAVSMTSATQRTHPTETEAKPAQTPARPTQPQPTDADMDALCSGFGNLATGTPEQKQTPVKTKTRLLLESILDSSPASAPPPSPVRQTTPAPAAVAVAATLAVLTHAPQPTPDPQSTSAPQQTPAPAPRRAPWRPSTPLQQQQQPSAAPGPAFNPIQSSPKSTPPQAKQDDGTDAMDAESTGNAAEFKFENTQTSSGDVEMESQPTPQQQQDLPAVATEDELLAAPTATPISAQAPFGLGVSQPPTFTQSCTKLGNPITNFGGFDSFSSSRPVTSRPAAPTRRRGNAQVRTNAGRAGQRPRDYSPDSNYRAPPINFSGIPLNPFGSSSSTSSQAHVPQIDPALSNAHASNVPFVTERPRTDEHMRDDCEEPDSSEIVMGDHLQSQQQGQANTTQVSASPSSATVTQNPVVPASSSAGIEEDDDDWEKSGPEDVDGDDPAVRVALCRSPNEPVRSTEASTEAPRRRTRAEIQAMMDNPANYGNSDEEEEDETMGDDAPAGQEAPFCSRPRRTSSEESSFSGFHVPQAQRPRRGSDDAIGEYADDEDVTRQINDMTVGDPGFDDEWLENQDNFKTSEEDHAQLTFIFDVDIYGDDSPTEAPSGGDQQSEEQAADDGYFDDDEPLRDSDTGKVITETYEPRRPEATGDLRFTGMGTHHADGTYTRDPTVPYAQQSAFQARQIARTRTRRADAAPLAGSTSPSRIRQSFFTVAVEPPAAAPTPPIFFTPANAAANGGELEARRRMEESAAERAIFHVPEILPQAPAAPRRTSRLPPPTRRTRQQTRAGTPKPSGSVLKDETDPKLLVPQHQLPANPTINQEFDHAVRTNGPCTNGVGHDPASQGHEAPPPAISRDGEEEICRLHGVQQWEHFGGLCSKCYTEGARGRAEKQRAEDAEEQREKRRRQETYAETEKNKKGRFDPEDDEEMSEEE